MPVPAVHALADSQDVFAKTGAQPTASEVLDAHDALSIEF
jgi:hypothetical protein